jgi:hypothetical protein
MVFTGLGFGNLKQSSQGQSPTFNSNVLVKICFYSCTLVANSWAALHVFEGLGFMPIFWVVSVPNCFFFSQMPVLSSVDSCLNQLKFIIRPGEFAHILSPFMSSELHILVTGFVHAEHLAPNFLRFGGCISMLENRIRMMIAFYICNFCIWVMPLSRTPQF